MAIERLGSCALRCCHGDPNLGRRLLAAGYRKITARARPAGYVLNRERTARLLNAWGFLRAGRKPHPKMQGKPFYVTASNLLWQAEMTSI